MTNSALSHGPPNLANAALAMDAGNNIYVFSGNNSDDSVTIWAYNLLANNWVKLCSAPPIVAENNKAIWQEMEIEEDEVIRELFVDDHVKKACAMVMDDAGIGFISHRIFIDFCKGQKAICRFFLTTIGNKNVGMNQKEYEIQPKPDCYSIKTKRLNVVDLDGTLRQFCTNDGLSKFAPLASAGEKKFFFITLNEQPIPDEYRETIVGKTFDTFFVYELARQQQDSQSQRDYWEWSRISDEANLHLLECDNQRLKDVMKKFANDSAVQCLFAFQHYIGVLMPITLFEQAVPLDKLLLFDTDERRFMLRELKPATEMGFPFGIFHCCRMDAQCAHQQEFIYFIGGLYQTDEKESAICDQCWRLNLNELQWEFFGHQQMEFPVSEYASCLSAKDQTIFIYGGITDFCSHPPPECNYLQRIQYAKTERKKEQ